MNQKTNKNNGKILTNDRGLQPMASGVPMPSVKPPKAPQTSGTSMPTGK